MGYSTLTMSLAKYIIAAGVLVLAGGFGYRYYKQNGLPAFSTPAPSSQISPSTPNGTSSQTPVRTPPNIDATWQTYRNNALQFLLQFPTRGIYAPKFTVKVVTENDPLVKAGCYDEIGGGTIERVALSGVDFCRVTHALNPPSVAIDTEYWSTKKNGRLAVITFTKKYSTSTPSFKIEDYRTFVTGLMSTFRYPDTSTTTNP